LLDPRPVFVVIWVAADAVIGLKLKGPGIKLPMPFFN